MRFFYDDMSEREFSNRLSALRRDFHRYPETRFCEYCTSVRIIEELEKLNLKILYGKAIHGLHETKSDPTPEQLQQAEAQAVEMTDRRDLVAAMRGGSTGCVAVLETGRPGPKVAIRMDIDALEVTEQDTDDHYPARMGFRSSCAGRMHACGHDGHAAIGIGAAELLVRNVDKLCGTLLFIFQPAEEGVRGAKSMIASGLLDDVDYLIGGHIGIGKMETGWVAASTRGLLSSDAYWYSFYGKGSHSAADPEFGKNALLAAACAALNIMALPRHGKGITRVNVGRLEAGTTGNIVPDQARMLVEVRGETDEICAFMSEGAERVCRNAAEMYGCTYDKQLLCDVCGATCDNDFAQLAEEALLRLPDVKKVLQNVPFGGGDDITFMMKRVKEHGGKAIEMGFGSPTSGPAHNARFDFDERVLPIAAKACASIAVKISEAYKEKRL